MLVSLTDESSANKKKLVKVELNYYFDITTNFNFVKHLKITKCILKNVKLNYSGDMVAYLEKTVYVKNIKFRKKDGSLRGLERCIMVFGYFFFTNQAWFSNASTTILSKKNS